jgi:hypothetical protein
MYKYNPDVIEYWFDLDANSLVLAFHSIVKELESNPTEKILNIIIESEYRKRYSMIIIKSCRPLSKQSLIDLLKKSLINDGKKDWQEGR